MEALRLLLEDPAADAATLPSALAELYGGGLGIRDGAVYSNFVTSLDGVVTLDAPGGAGPTISGRSEADRFVMGLLRAMAGCVVIGAGTLRAEAAHLWTPAYIYPPAAAAFAELRKRLGLAPEPRLVVVSRSGRLPTSQPALKDAMVLTGARTAASVVDEVRAAGYGRILTEGGPHLLASFVEERRLDEMFLTLSPVLAGRPPEEERFGMLQGVALLPERGLWARLASLRSHGSHLFLRYALSRSGAE